MKSMSVNSQVNVQREILVPNSSNTHGSKSTGRVANDFFSSINYLNQISITRAGRYDRVEKVPNPIKSWHKASKGATERFSGGLSQMFPELKNLSEKELKKIQCKRHGL